MELLCDHRCIKLTVCLFQAVMVLCRKAAQLPREQAGCRFVCPLGQFEYTACSPAAVTRNVKQYVNVS